MLIIDIYLYFDKYPALTAIYSFLAGLDNLLKQSKFDHPMPDQHLARHLEEALTWISETITNF